MKRIQISMSEPLLKTIDKEAERKGISRSELIRQVFFAHYKVDKRNQKKKHEKDSKKDSKKDKNPENKNQTPPPTQDQMENTKSPDYKIDSEILSNITKNTPREEE